MDAGQVTTEVRNEASSVAEFLGDFVLILEDLAKLCGIPMPGDIPRGVDRSRMQYIASCMHAYVADLRLRVMRGHETEKLLEHALTARAGATEQAYRNILGRALRALPEQLRPTEGYEALPEAIEMLWKQSSQAGRYDTLEAVRQTLPLPFRPGIAEIEQLPARINAWAAHLNREQRGGNGSHP